MFVELTEKLSVKRVFYVSPQRFF